MKDTIEVILACLAIFVGLRLWFVAYKNQSKEKEEETIYTFWEIVLAGNALFLHGLVTLAEHNLLPNGKALYGWLLVGRAVSAVACVYSLYMRMRRDRSARQKQETLRQAEGREVGARERIGNR